MLNAIVLITAEPSKVAELGPKLASLDGVSEVYSVTGDEDLVALLHVGDTEEIARLVTEHIAPLRGVNATRTLIAFRQYSPDDISF
jgi:DNA-binding Lrp family transcriptional regulator